MSEETTTEQRGARKVLQGIVVSDKMDKTIVVLVEDRLVHLVQDRAVLFFEGGAAGQNRCGHGGGRRRPFHRAWHDRLSSAEWRQAPSWRGIDRVWV